ncbi:Serine/threonine-protein phosphatase 4 regulatory subunit 2 [Papilio xuthus]|uniref:Serine/threonine-protein phosphatase 4 regulatory subunit 2 n=1 Tax=Papilio xuthus TaxID=66420 RepID=A0A194PMZ6_PAPXU|nr:Serine/threonine-protein phosphatase 4 regulatory subunit 2 [Papilio xuthus]
MENAEEVFHLLEEFSKRKPKTIPQELNDYLAYVARTGDPVYQWSLVKCLFKEKLLNVITDFYETTPGIEIPPYPNVDPFNYDIMKNSLLERLDSFTSAPFTIQRICELLAFPRKQYNRVDKFMRAIEKNILVVSTREPGIQRHIEQENGEPMEPIVNGSDNNSEYNVDVEMEDVSWKENSEQNNTDPQPSSSDTHISVDNNEEKVHPKLEIEMDTQEKLSHVQEPAETENSLLSNTPPPQELENKSSETVISESISDTAEQPNEELNKDSNLPLSAVKEDDKMKTDEVASVLIVPEIKIDDAEMTEQKLKAQYDETVEVAKEESKNEKEIEDTKPCVDPPQAINEDSCSSSNSKEDVSEPKIISEVSTSSEESSSSSDNTDGNSNSPRTDPESHTDVQVSPIIVESVKEVAKEDEEKIDETPLPSPPVENPTKPSIQTDNYSISDVNSEIQQIPTEAFTKSDDIKESDTVEEKTENKPEETESQEKTEETQ